MMKTIRAMRIKSGCVILLLLATLPGCASTSEPGWTGSGASPFDAARAECLQQSQDHDQAAFEACMASKGWRRPR
jgi:hypothetical protein